MRFGTMIVSQGPTDCFFKLTGLLGSAGSFSSSNTHKSETRHKMCRALRKYLQKEFRPHAGIGNASIYRREAAVVPIITVSTTAGGGRRANAFQPRAFAAFAHLIVLRAVADDAAAFVSPK